MSHLGGAFDLRMEDDPVTSIRQRLAVRGDDRGAGLLMQPGVRGSHAFFKSETINRDGALCRRHGKIDQERSAAFAPQRFQEPEETTLAGNECVSRLFTQFPENWIEQRILKFL